MANFTLQEARDLLPEVIEITDHYFHRVREIQKTLDNVESDQQKQDLSQQIHYTFMRWVEEISSLGAEVKGPWLVDFDSGDGIYYCWQYGEKKIQFFHRYETGFRGRRPIHKLKSSE